jgi:predicted metal-dependent peptidase
VERWENLLRPVGREVRLIRPLILAHEMLHAALRHGERRGGRESFPG